MAKFYDIQRGVPQTMHADLILTINRPWQARPRQNAKLAARDDSFRMAILSIKPIHDNWLNRPVRVRYQAGYIVLLKGEASRERRLVGGVSRDQGHPFGEHHPCRFE